MKCKLCHRNFIPGGFSRHLRIIHKLTVIEYLRKYKLIPKCVICRKEAKQVYNKGFKFQKTCGSKECFRKLQKRIKNQPENKRKASIKRKQYLRNTKNHNWSRYKNKESKPERLFKEILEKLIIDDEILQYYIPEEAVKNYEIDFVLQKRKVGFEINGNQHYTKKGQLRIYYKKRHEYLEKLGWKIIEIHYILCFKEEMIKKVIQEALNGKHNFSDQKTKEIFRYQKPKIKRRTREQYFREVSKKYLEQRQQRIEDVTKVDFLIRGSVKTLQEKWGISSSNVRQFIRKYCPQYDVTIKGKNLNENKRLHQDAPKRRPHWRNSY